MYGKRVSGEKEFLISLISIVLNNFHALPAMKLTILISALARPLHPPHFSVNIYYIALNSRRTLEYALLAARCYLLYNIGGKWQKLAGIGATIEATVIKMKDNHE